MPVGPSGVENLAGHLSGNPLNYPLGGQHGLPFGGDHSHAVLGLASIIHSLLGGAGPGAVGAISSSYTPGPPTPPPGVTAPPAGSYNPAQFYRETGHPQYAAQLWESHHPYAVHHGHIPGWVSQALAKAIQGAMPQSAPAPAVPSPTVQMQ